MSAPALPTSLVAQPAPRPLGPVSEPGPHRADRHRQGRDRAGRRDRDAARSRPTSSTCRSSASPCCPATPTDGPTSCYTTSSPSIQFGRLALRLVCAEVRAKSLDRAALRLELQPRRVCRCVDGAIPAERRGRPARITGRVAGEIDLSQAVTGTAPIKQAAAYKVVGRSVPRVDLPAKVCGAGLRARHAAGRHAACPGRAPAAAPARRSGVARRGRDPPRREGRASQIVRDGQFRRLRQRRRDGRRRPPPRRRRRMSTWDERRAASARAGGGALAVAASPRGPAHRRAAVGPRRRSASSRSTVYADLYRACLDRAVLRAGRVPRRPAHGVDASAGHPSAAQEPGGGARPARSRRSPSRTCTGPGCYGHNGADDAAPDAALIAMRLPGRCIRPALAARGGVRLRAGQPGDGDDPACRSRRARPAGRLDDRDLERTARRSGRAAAGNLLAAEALPDPPPGSPPTDPPEARGGGGTRNGVPLYDLPAKRILHHLIPRDAGAHLVAARARRDCPTSSPSNP